MLDLVDAGDLVVLADPHPDRPVEDERQERGDDQGVGEDREDADGLLAELFESAAVEEALGVGLHATGGEEADEEGAEDAADEVDADDVEGLFYGGGLDQFWKQCAGVFGVLAYSLVVSAVLALLLDKTIGMRVSEDDEVAGIDQAEHAETAYDFSGAGGGAARTAVPAGVAGAESKKVDA